MRRTSSREWPLPSLALVLALATLMGCGPPERETILLWHAYRGEEARALQDVLKTWKGAPVQTLAVPHDAFATKLSSAIPLGEGPHLFIDAHERLGDYKARGLVAPVTDGLDSNKVFGETAIDAVSLDGVPYGVPLSQKSLALYYNPKLVDKAPEHLEDIVALRAELPADVFPLVYEAPNTYGHAPVLTAFGGQLLTKDDKFAFFGPEAERSITFARDLIRNKVVPENADGALVTQLFSSGRAAFAVSGPWLATDFAKDVPFGVAVLPKLKETGLPMRPLLTVEAAMMSPKGAEWDEVRQLAKLLASKEAAEVRQKVARTVSARTDTDIAKDEFLKVFTEQAAVTVPMPTSVAMRAVWEPANKAIKKVLRGDMEAPEALAEAKARFEDVYKPPPEPASSTPLMFIIGALLFFAAYKMTKNAKDASFRRKVRESLPAYGYIAHAVIALGLLLFIPLFAGAAISLYAGQPGNMYYVGFTNFIEILTARGGSLLSSGSFYVVLLITILWTVTNVTLHLALGMSVGVLLSRPLLKLKAVYRVLLIIPWAVPNYVTALSWKGMFHRQFGAVTALINASNDLLGTDVEAIDWFASFSTSFTANLSTNVWLGFPFMMVVTVAAMTSVPKDVLEAAEVDGASRFQRFWLVTFPIIRPSMLPATVLGAVWTFNMFNVVFLVSGGEPDGQTEILVSEAYRWAFTRQAQYGYAAAYAVLIFLLLYVTPRIPGVIMSLVKRFKPSANAGPQEAT